MKALDLSTCQVEVCGHGGLSVPAPLGFLETKGRINRCVSLNAAAWIHPLQPSPAWPDLCVLVGDGASWALRAHFQGQGGTPAGGRSGLHLLCLGALEADWPLLRPASAKHPGQAPLWATWLLCLEHFLGELEEEEEERILLEALEGFPPPVPPLD